MRKVWIVGSEGMLGNALLKQCALFGISAVGTNKEQADITRKECLDEKAREISPSHIVNCAAYTNVDKAEMEYDLAFQVNALGAQNVAETARDIGARLIHISTDFVFDDSCERPFREDAQIKPVNAYGKSKWEGEKRVHTYYPDACTIRTSWLFGRGGKNFFSSMIHWLQTKEHVAAVHDQSGCATYAPDLANAILELLDEKGIFHFAHPNPASRFEMAQFAYEFMQKQGIALACKQVTALSKEAFPMPALRPVCSVLCTEKYTRITGKRPRDWQEALKEFITDAAR
jgi:dTDP-4-dehydrorhamnose reductase